MYTYCKEQLTKQILANKLAKHNEYSPKFFISIILIIVVVPIIIMFLPSRHGVEFSYFNKWVIGISTIVLIFVLAFIYRCIDLSKGEKIFDTDFKNVRVFDSFGRPDKHFEQFIEECENGKYYRPYKFSTVEECYFFGTDNYIVFFCGGIMSLIPAQELLYAYARAYNTRGSVSVEFIILMNSGTKITLYYGEDNIMCAERFLYNIYGINVGFSREKKRAYKQDPFIFRNESEKIRSSKKSEIEKGIFAEDTDYPYSFSTQETDPRNFTGGLGREGRMYFCFTLSMVFFLCGLFIFISGGGSDAIIFAVAGVWFFCGFLLEMF